MNNITLNLQVDVLNTVLVALDQQSTASRNALLMIKAQAEAQMTPAPAPVEPQIVDGMGVV